MRFTQAKRLHNEDEVEVRVAPGVWKHGRVLGEPYEAVRFVTVAVLLDDGAYMADVLHTEVR